MDIQTFEMLSLFAHISLRKITPTHKRSAFTSQICVKKKNFVKTN